MYSSLFVALLMYSIPNMFLLYYFQGIVSLQHSYTYILSMSQIKTAPSHIAPIRKIT